MKHTAVTEANLEALVGAFYARVRFHETLGPISNAALAGRWDVHLARMVDFWSSVLLASRRSAFARLFNLVVCAPDASPCPYREVGYLVGSRMQALAEREGGQATVTVAQNRAVLQQVSSRITPISLVTSLLLAVLTLL